MFAPSFFDHLEDRLNLAVYDTNDEWRRQVKFKITEPTFFFQKNRKPGEILESPVGPYKYHVDGGLKRTPQFEELQNPFNEKPMSITGLKSGIWKDTLAEMKKQLTDAQNNGVASLKSVVATESAKMEAAVDGAKAKVSNEVSDMLQEFAEFTNGGPA